MNPRPRLLLIGPPPDHLNGTLAGADVESVPDAPAEVARRLRDPSYDGVVAGRDAAAGLLDRFRRDELILGHIDKGIAVLDPAGTVLWANPEFARMRRQPAGAAGPPRRARLAPPCLASGAHSTRRDDQLRLAPTESMGQPDECRLDLFRCRNRVRKNEPADLFR